MVTTQVTVDLELVAPPTASDAVCDEVTRVTIRGGVIDRDPSTWLSSFYYWPVRSSKTLKAHPPHPLRERSGTVWDDSCVWRVGSVEAATNPPHIFVPWCYHHEAPGLLPPLDVHYGPVEPPRGGIPAA
jgi:hypothetical protein